ncbi:6-pyruvoyl trahydropterin synthase family protein [Rubrobacter calidifluminis]|uniref:6-pyruvoyl trahydropterin synthase family protein n=1 Tax=Rubrobacter calidifluminis TaxID=1392640 RepID=UPI002361A35A|nr:6-carboxytetrahydropterin synthase [Rubrobacter calidifluminis]
MYEIFVAAGFEAAHSLPEGFGPASRTHGHTYRLEVILRGESLREDGTLYDLGELKPAVEELAASLHYRNLNEVEGLSAGPTTAEAIADYCWERLASSLRDRGLDSLTVRVWENPSAYAAREDAL